MILYENHSYASMSSSIWQCLAIGRRESLFMRG